jgi:DNA-binding transcriptional LysR family regulator
MAQAFGGWMPKLDKVMEIRSTETIKQAVIAGMGVSFLSAHTVTLERRLGSLVILDVQGFPLMLNWYVVHRKKKRLPAVAVAFKNFLISEGAMLIEAITHFSAQPGTTANAVMKAPRKPRRGTSPKRPGRQS